MTNEELNDLVAEKIMEWETKSPKNRGIDCIIYFEPCEQIAHAWLIVEKMRKDGYDINIQSINEGDGFWWTIGIGEALVDDKSVTHGIVLAALQAKGVSCKE